MENTQLQKPKIRKVRDTYDQMLSLPKSVKDKIAKICLHKNKKISHLFCEFINKELETIETKNTESKIKNELVDENTTMLFAFQEVLHEINKLPKTEEFDVIKSLIQKNLNYEKGNIELISESMKSLKEQTARVDDLEKTLISHIDNMGNLINELKNKNRLEV